MVRSSTGNDWMVVPTVLWCLQDAREIGFPPGLGKRLGQWLLCMGAQLSFPIDSSLFHHWRAKDSSNSFFIARWRVETPYLHPPPQLPATNIVWHSSQTRLSLPEKPTPSNLNAHCALSYHRSNLTIVTRFHQRKVSNSRREPRDRALKPRGCPPLPGASPPFAYSR